MGEVQDLCVSCERFVECPVIKLDWRKYAVEKIPVDFDVELSVTGCSLYVDKRVLTTAKVMKKYPLITAHIICESLGYATPNCASRILLDALNKGENWCEWIASCYECVPLRAVRDAIKHRHSHRGYMAEIKLAKTLVLNSIKTGEEPLLASWF